MLYDYYFLDWYSLLHFWWGTLYAVIFSPISGSGIDFYVGFLIALGIALLFELVENSCWYIDNITLPGFRKYVADTKANMIGDVFSSSAGFIFIWAFSDDKGVDGWQLPFIMSCVIGLFGGFVITMCIDPQDEQEQKRGFKDLPNHCEDY